LWPRDGLQRPASKRCAALALQSLPQGFLSYVRDAVRLPNAAPVVFDGDRDLRERGQGQVHAGDVPRSRCPVKTAFVVAHKTREAMAAELRQVGIGGEGKKAEVDGAYFGGYVKPANRREEYKDRRLRRNQNGKRKVVVVIRERGGKALPGVFRNEADALTFTR
jgi:hypothetical protein